MRTLFEKLSLPIVGFLVSATSLAAPDVIVLNGDVYTVDSRSPRVEAFAVEDGKFSAVGSNVLIQGLADSDTIIIDAQGNTVTPGFIDGHAHVGGNSPAVYGVDLSYIPEKEEWLRLIKEADEKMEEGEWLTGGWWDHTLTDSVYPTKDMLDAVVPDRPVLLNHIDGHYGWANTKAMELAGVTAETEVPPGGEIVLDPETGEPMGIFLEGAQNVIRQIIPERTDAQRLEGLAEMQEHANSLGITGLHQMGSLDDYLYIVENGDPTLRVWYGHWGPGGSDAVYEQGVRDIVSRQAEVSERVAQSGKENSSGPLLQLGYVKLINDGVLSAHTAVLLEGYEDREGWSGEYITSPAELAFQVDTVTKAGLPVAIHSIGDAAVRASLDAFEEAVVNKVPYPNRIEHIEILHPDDLARFRQLNIVASMQPNHGTNSIGYVPERVGARRSNRAYVWNSFINAGVPLVFGADYATSPLSPLVQIADAMFRISPFGFNEGEPFYPSQRLSFEQALYAYTQAGAGITAWADEVGSISVGKWADFVILDGKVPAPMNRDEFYDLSVQQTYFAGREVFKK